MLTRLYTTTSKPLQKEKIYKKNKKVIHSKVGSK